MKLMAICVFLLAMVGCGHVITEGDIIDKRYEPARTWVSMVPIVISNGKTTSTILVPMTHYDDEDFVLTIQGCDEDGNPASEEFFVSRSVYESVSVGGYYQFDADMDEMTDPICKKRVESK